jgi:retinol dehydrogenase-12
MVDIEAATGYRSELWILDLAKFASVLEFADKFEKDGGRIDILIANAGVVWPDYRETVDGWEETWALMQAFQRRMRIT